MAAPAEIPPELLDDAEAPEEVRVPDLIEAARPLVPVSV
jgi:hypothetical protein